MGSDGTPYYRADLARIHHLGFGFHADACAPGILALLEPVRERDGLVIELGCGSGLLTKYLVDAGHRVIATDASPAMLDLAREHAAGAQEIRLLTLPDDPIPSADAIVSVGHVLSYLPSADAIDQALVAIARALRPGRARRDRSVRSDLRGGGVRTEHRGVGRRRLGHHHDALHAVAGSVRPADGDVHAERGRLVAARRRTP